VPGVVSATEERQGCHRIGGVRPRRSRVGPLCYFDIMCLRFRAFTLMGLHAASSRPARGRTASRLSPRRGNGA